MDNLPNRKRNRLQKYDYSQAGFYFVTACINNREECFGKVEEAGVVLTGQGEIARQFWQEIPNHYKGVELDEFIIMPNHIHGIVIIESRTAGGWPYKTPALSIIIGSYKNIVSKTIRKLLNPNFEWQHSFYDTVIRSDEGLSKIREYIGNNPKQWELDEYNPTNIK